MASNKAIYEHVAAEWDKTIVLVLEEYIRIPNQSPLFDKEWATNGYQDQAIDLIVGWVKKQAVKGLEVEVIREVNRTPLIFIEVPPTNPECKETVMLYGHMDKQPPMAETWDSKFGGPWDPRIIDGKLYGRGGADDGYSTFAAITAIAALQANGVPHARCVVTIEACEESGSKDLPHYVEALKERIGTPTLIVCLDSGCGNYEQLWLTTSLRGACNGNLRVEILNEGIHSGKGSGVVASSFRILRQLLSRIEDENTGEILVKELYAEVPPHRMAQLKEVAAEVGEDFLAQYPFVENAKAVTNDVETLILNNTWRPTLCITGIDGLPHNDVAGNVLRAFTSAKLAFRLPPTCDAQYCAGVVKEIVEKDPPYGAKVTFDMEKGGSGWNAPQLDPWLKKAVEDASMAHFGKSVRMQGEGGSIPFMGMLAQKFPGAQFMITGVLGPNSNAHGPNEFLHIGTGKAVTGCVASVLAAHHAHFNNN